LTAPAVSSRFAAAKLRIANAEVRLPAYTPGAPAGLMTGNFGYHTDTREVTFDVTGAAIPLEAIGKIQSERLPVGGRLNLQARGQGPLKAPEVHATLRLIDLKLGSDVVGSFDGKVDSDGHHLAASIDSAMSTGRLTGKVDVTLGGDYPVTAEVTADRIDFDPFLASAMHLSKLKATVWWTATSRSLGLEPGRKRLRWKRIFRASHLILKK